MIRNFVYFLEIYKILPLIFLISACIVLHVKFKKGDLL